MIRKRVQDWNKQETEELSKWVEKNSSVLLKGLAEPLSLLQTSQTMISHQDEKKSGESGEGVLVGDYERREMCKHTTELIMFPLLRLELQGFPYLSTHVTRLFLSVAKEETDGLKKVVNNITRERAFDLADAQKRLNDAYS